MTKATYIFLPVTQSPLRLVQCRTRKESDSSTPGLKNAEGWVFNWIDRSKFVIQHQTQKLIRCLKLLTTSEKKIQEQGKLLILPQIVEIIKMFPIAMLTENPQF